MRSQEVFVAVMFFVLAMVIRHGTSVICYQCNSKYDPRCGDPFDPYSLGTVNCSFQPRLEHLDHEPTLCRKISQKVYGKYRIVRGCGFLEDEIADNNECLKRSGTHDVNALYCSCTTNLCNNTNISQPSMSHLVLLSFGALLVTGILRAL